MPQPRGIRNHNPGNIEWGDPWQGLLPIVERSDPRFAQFTLPTFGIRALARVLIAYQDKHGIRTIEAAINRWAPPVENDTGAYAAHVAGMAGVGAKARLDFHRYEHLRPLVEGIIRHENGAGPLKTPNTWYTAAQVDEGLRLAGVRPDPATVAKVPVTRETAAASAGVVVGIGQLAEVGPAVVAALDQASGDLSSGDIVRVVLGVLTIAVSVLVAYSQVRKYQQGVA